MTVQLGEGGGDNSSWLAVWRKLTKPDWWPSADTDLSPAVGSERSETQKLPSLESAQSSACRPAVCHGAARGANNSRDSRAFHRQEMPPHASAEILQSWKEINCIWRWTNVQIWFKNNHILLLWWKKKNDFFVVSIVISRGWWRSLLNNRQYQL